LQSFPLKKDLKSKYSRLNSAYAILKVLHLFS